MKKIELTPIRTKADYKAALVQAAKLVDLDPTKSSVEGKYLEVLAILIEDYERKNYPTDPVDPIEAIKFRMDQASLTAKDLVPAIGNLNRVYEVLNGKRALSINMIKNLNKKFGIPLSSLIS